MYDVSDENRDRRWAAQGTLWVALETSLRLLHPMMPFVTEELWQRLPGRGALGPGETETIMLAKYPEFRSSNVDEDAERLMAETMKVVRACRSLRASYHVPNKTLLRFFIKASRDCASDATRQLADIMTLAKASTVEVNAADVPRTVGTFILDDQLTVFMDVKGLIDFDVEIRRLNKNLHEALPQIQALEERMEADGYQNAPDTVRKSNQDRLESLRKKRSELEAALTNFESLKRLEDS
jgi:valyl-tRNA synthetase